jgi:multiple sugar transport system substrate-binding protein/putative aldouronate transport system substrate-binding protein
MKQAIAGEITPEDAIAQYNEAFGDISAQILDELNAQ